MSFFRATVPEGSYFFHGSQRSDRPTGFEWLAFEIEHSQFFATPWDPSRGPGRGPGRDPDGVDVEEWHDWRRAHSAHGAKPVLFLSDQDSQHPMIISEDGRRGSNVSGPTRGYLHTYRAARPLNLLYVDGMGAGKSKYGTLDTQDFILRGKTPGEFEGVPGGGVSGESDRAKELCEVADEWARQGGGRIDGIMRMEVGFEIIYCHFEEGGGLDLVSLDATALRNETGWVDPQVHAFEWVRAVGLRYVSFDSQFWRLWVICHCPGVHTNTQVIGWLPKDQAEYRLVEHSVGLLLQHQPHESGYAEERDASSGQCYKQRKSSDQVQGTRNHGGPATHWQQYRLARYRGPAGGTILG